MNSYFLDTSALVKRYVTETGTPWIQNITDPAAHNWLIIARITWVEVLSALMRRQREGNLLPRNVAIAIQDFRFSIDTRYQIVDLSDSLIESAGRLIQKHPLRTYDAVQLAAALQVQPTFAQAKTASLVFLSADERLLKIAQAEGLTTDNPNQHQ